MFEQFICSELFWFSLWYGGLFFVLF